MDDAETARSDASGSITMLFKKWRQGNSESVNELMVRFRPRLLALARSTLRGRAQRAADAEDALQSALISFWKKVESGAYEHEMRRDDLWNVLGKFTVHKALKLQEHERAQKRGGLRVVTGAPLEKLPQRQNSASLDVACMELLELLDPDLRSFALLRLMGNKNREIAEQFGCTERKVERKLQLIRAVWEAEFMRTAPSTRVRLADESE